ncbi:MAG: OmpH family outer membrane protein [Bacteroidia bacterium]|nr:OmpH family outer membrane protein [Bacteroidia bacterium]
MNPKIKTLAFLVLAAIGFSANAQKIAHLNLDSLISSMPESKTVKEESQNYLKSLENEVMAMTEEFQKKYNDYMANAEKMSELVRKTKEEELTGMQRRIEEFKISAQQDYQKKMNEYLQPLVEKAKKAIEAVAKESGYKYVLDVTPGNSNVLYSEPSDDIFNAVKKKLDSMPPAQIPGTKSNNNPPSENKPKTNPQTGTGTKPKSGK